jgi:hypothetical protein
VRLWWMLLGNAALVAAAKVIADTQDRFLSWADGLFWAVATVTVTLRYLDVHRFGGLTASGRPATPAGWRRYAAIYLPVAAALWGVAHAAARLGW